MKKHTASTTATTYTLVEQHPNFRSMDAETRADIAQPYVWKSEGHARDVIRTMTDTNGFEHTVHFAPGLEVHAFYVNGAMLTVIVIEDDTATRLHTAVRRERPVTITYVKADGEEVVRTIEPTGLKLTKSGDVIVKAMDRASGEKRSFRTDRVQAYTVHRTRFTVRTPAPAPSKTVLAQEFQAQAREYTVEYRDAREGERVLYVSDSEGEASFVKAVARQDAHLTLIAASF